MSALPPVYGHRTIREPLARAARRGVLPSSLLLHGPTGVGKQRLALWLARSLVCSAADEEPREPCGSCRDCRLALRLEHPDVHWFFPLKRPRSSGSLDKLIEALEDARADELEARRSTPWRATVPPSGPVGIFLAQVHAIRRLTAARPVMSGRQVVIVGDAELLVPQESSTEAANAFLKLLEEPPADTTFILTTAEPDALLPTMRSRLHPARLRPLPDAEVIRFLTDERQIETAEAHRVARLAQGSIGRALGFLPDDDGEPGPLEALRRKAHRLLKAAAAPGAPGRLAAAHAQKPSGARGEFHDMLEFLGGWIRDLAAVEAGAEGVVVNADAVDWLRETASRLPAAGSGAPDALHAIDQARALARGNVNPQLTMAWLLDSIHRALAPAAVRPPTAHTPG